YQVSLSTRSHLKFGSSYLQQALFGPFIMAFEQFGAWFHIRLPDTNPRMVGGETRRLVRDGLVPLHPDIREVREGTVLFEDGQEAGFELIIYATGYRPVLDHLHGLVELDPRTGHPRLLEMQARDVPGLYFLGLDNLRSFRSRYLRGIREDAAALARTLEARVRNLVCV
ncbi:MAG: hypothetical protein AB1758_37860, partial [Candidatus Eremiobacterota bacterium]